MVPTLDVPREESKSEGSRNQEGGTRGLLRSWSGAISGLVMVAFAEGFDKYDGEDEGEHFGKVAGQPDAFDSHDEGQHKDGGDFEDHGAGKGCHGRDYAIIQRGEECGGEHVDATDQETEHVESARMSGKLMKMRIVADKHTGQHTAEDFGQ